MDRCLTAVLSRWMNEKDDVKAFGGSTKENLVSALKEIEENALAEVITQTALGELNVCITMIFPAYIYVESYIVYSFSKCP